MMVNPSVLHNVGGEGAESNLLDRQPSRPTSRRRRLPRREEGGEGAGGGEETRPVARAVNGGGEVGDKRGGVPTWGGKNI